MGTPNTPYERSYWVLPGKLLAGYYPGDRDLETCHEKLQALVDSGVRHVMNLVEEARLDNYGRPIDYPSRLAGIAGEMGIDVSYSHNPVTDLGIPTRERMKSILGSPTSKAGTANTPPNATGGMPLTQLLIRVAARLNRTTAGGRHTAE